ncbi:MAG: CoA transferase [Planctomycetes bacterium]|nr:CoA transferase [Planctomycetota bacterium]
MSAPLEGYRVLEVSHALAGPFAGMALGDLGADVIKIEPPGGRTGDVGASAELRGESVYFMSLNRNKRSVVLDLKHPADRARFHALARTADVMLDNTRPGVAARLGFDAKTLRRLNPRVICCSITGYGRTGPFSGRPGFDYHVQALSGAMAITGEPGGKPTKSGLSVIDHMAGYVAAGAVVAALLRRERTGEAADIDLSLLDIQMAITSYLAAHYLQTGEKPRRVANSGHARGVPFQLFRASDGWVMVAAYTDKHFALLCRCLSQPALARDPRFATQAARFRHRRPLLRLLAGLFAAQPCAHWQRKLVAAGLAIEPVRTLDEALRHPQVRARGMVVKAPHPRGGTFRAVGHPFRISGMGAILRPPPSYGQHTEELVGQRAPRLPARP